MWVHTTCLVKTTTVSFGSVKAAIWTSKHFWTNSREPWAHKEGVGPTRYGQLLPIGGANLLEFTFSNSNYPTIGITGDRHTCRLIGDIASTIGKVAIKGIDTSAAFTDVLSWVNALYGASTLQSKPRPTSGMGQLSASIKKNGASYGREK
jgi:hypothetical protein